MNNHKIRLIHPSFVRKFVLSLIIFIALYIMAARITGTDFLKLWSGLGIIYKMITQDLWPPEWSYFSTSFQYLIETWNMALISTTLAAIVALPLTCLASKNINKNKTLYNIVRSLLNFLRTIPDIILAIIVVAFLGLGATSGIIALTIFSSGILAKMLSESTEGIDNGPITAIEASGGNKLQVIKFAVLPQILPYYASYTLFVLETNVKASVVLGFIGAGGIGTLLNRNMQFFKYGRLMMILIVIFVTISIIDFISNTIRGHLE